MALAKAYWQELVKPMIDERYASVKHRIAAGLVGHGSECYGFDDALSATMISVARVPVAHR